MGSGDKYGDFVVTDLLGEGGMGAVWSARHEPTGQPAAIKLLRDMRASGETRAAFEAEVRMVARCRHPNVIRILDYGLTRGERWFAMERVDGGDLRAAPPRSWNEVRSVLAPVLRGLAHAHARGITHRDLKPENILVGTDGPVLTDFGLAHRLRSGQHTHAQLHVSGGTPLYMSPEQILGNWRDFGPWTDLYALGCITYEWVTGAPPFEHERVLDLVRMHLELEPPELVPRFSVPDGLVGWLAMLLDKPPHRRLGSAREALASLPAKFETVDETPTHVAAAGAPTLQVLPTIVHAPTLEATPPEPLSIAPLARLPSRADVKIPLEVPKTPMRSRGLDWQSSGVFALRPPLLESLAEHRRELWESLVDCVQSKTSKVVLIEGPDGAGIEPLAWWLAERAHEHAAARVFRAAHDVVPGPYHGLSGMLMKALRLDELDMASAAHRLGEQLETVGLGSMLPMAASAMMLDDRAGTAPSSRFTTVRRLVHNFSRGHVAVVILDDLHLSPDSCNFALDLARSPDRVMGPLLVLGLVSEQAQSGASARLRENPAVEVILVQPIAPEVLADELRRELRVDPGLAREIAQLTGGFSEYAIRLLGEWLRSGALQSSDGVWERVQSDDLSPTPIDRAELWQDHVHRLVWNDAELLQLGAAVELGDPASVPEWFACLEQLGLADSPELWDRLARSGLAERDDRLLRVKYSPFRDAVRSRLIDSFQMSAVHRALAEVLRRTELEATRRGQLANHLLKGGAPAEALREAVVALDEALRYRGTLKETLEQTIAIAEHARSLGAPIDATDALVLELAHAESARNHANAEEALRRTDAIWQRPDSFGARATLVRAAALMQLGQLADSQALLESRLEGPDDPAYQASMRRSLATLGLRLEDHELVENNTRLALRLLDAERDPVAVGWSYYRLADLERQRNNLERAHAELAEAREHFEVAGFEVGLGECMNVEGALYTTAERHSEALECYRRAHEMMRRAGSTWAVTARLNIALATIMLGEAASLNDTVAELRDELRSKNFELLNTFGVMVECAIAADLGDTERFDVAAYDAEARLLAMEESESDMRDLIEWIAERWASRDDELRARWLAGIFEQRTPD